MKARVILGCALALGAISAFAQGERPGLRSEMETFFMKWDKAVMSGNVKNAWPFFHKGYYMVDTQGKRTNYPEFKQMVMQMAKSMKMVSCKTRIWNVQLQNQEAVVWVQSEMVWKEPAGGGKWATKRDTSRWAENLVPSGNKWLFRSSQQLMTNEPWTFKTTGG